MDALNLPAAQPDRTEFKGTKAAGELKNRAARFITDPAYAIHSMKKNPATTASYIGMSVLTILTWSFLSDGYFSVALASASMISMMSFTLLSANVQLNRGVKGISVRMMEIYFILHWCRLIAIIPFDGYLPAGTSGDWLYPLTEIFSTIVLGWTLYKAKNNYMREDWDDQENANLTHIICGVSTFLAMAFHADLNRNRASDIAWAASMYMESVAAMPQLFLFQKNLHVEKWTAHFLAAQTVAKCLTFLFWAAFSGELAVDHDGIRNMTPWCILIAQAFQLLLMGDFMLHYGRCLLEGTAFSDSMLI